jgi:hypothetical protein
VTGSFCSRKISTKFPSVNNHNLSVFLSSEKKIPQSKGLVQIIAKEKSPDNHYTSVPFFLFDHTEIKRIMG